jgi:hypothetical protein
MFIQFFTSSMGGGIARLTSEAAGIIARNGVRLINPGCPDACAGRQCAPSRAVFPPSGIA